MLCMTLPKMTPETHISMSVLPVRLYIKVYRRMLLTQILRHRTSFLLDVVLLGVYAFTPSVLLALAIPAFGRNCSKAQS